MGKNVVYLIGLVLVLAVLGSDAWAQENQIINSEFDEGFEPWVTYEYQNTIVGFTAEVVGDAGLYGRNAAMIDITDSPALASIGIAQSGLVLEPGVTYPIGFTAMAEEDRGMVVLLQANLNDASWPTYLTETVQLTTSPQDFVIEYRHSGNTVGDDDTETVTLYLMIKGPWWHPEGENLNGKVWIDRVFFGAEPAPSLTRRADDLYPSDGAPDMPPDVVLSWIPGDCADTHDVYFGTVFDDVNAASRDNPLGVLVSEGQAEDSYDPPGALTLGQTYYWRIDEVNAPPDSTIFKGDVWSFTVEPVLYQITSITATASIPPFAEGQGPGRTIDGSGLNAAGQHTKTDADMWLGDASAGGPVWIQYDFDTVYKLEEMLVWNYNAPFEPFLGFGARNVMIEYSADGGDWVTLGDYEWARAPGQEMYGGGITVDFAGVPARHVRININQNWGTIARYGLSEVQFYCTPVYAREPQPADGQTDLGLDVTLRWRSGREAAAHEVQFGDDRDAVVGGAALGETVTQSAYDLTGLEFGKEYFWRITEVNEAATPGTWTGPVWSFLTQEYAAIADFEHYSDDDSLRIYEVWRDGYEDPANGSLVGYDTAPFEETTIVHGGRLSMPLRYDNSGGVAISEAERTFGPPQDWTVGGADTLRLYYHGRPIGFLPTSDSSIIMNGLGDDIWDVADECRYAYKQLSGNGSIVAKVESVDNTNEWAKVGVMIRETLQPGSRNAFVAVTPRQGVVLQYRSVANHETSNVQQTGFAAPYWVKLTRAGDRFTAQRSADGINWVSITDDPAASTVEVPMGASVYVGLAVCSHDAETAAGARFSNIATTGTVTGQWQSASIGLEQPEGNGADTLSLSVTDSANHVKTVTNPDPYALGATSWSVWYIPLSTLTSAGVDTSSVSKLAITAGDANAGSSGATGILFLDDIEIGRPFIHSGPADVTTPDDTVRGVPNDADWPAGEVPSYALDNLTATKFLHFKGMAQPTGLRVTPVLGASVVTGLTLTTANDVPERDPVAFELYGSNEGIDGPYTLIAAGDIADFAQETAWPRLTANATPIVFENDAAYTHYQILFTAVRDPDTANSMQIAEIEFIGSLAP